VPNHPIDRASKEWLACYPRRTFYSLSDNLFHTESPDHYNRLSSLLDLSILQSGKYILLCLTIDIFQFKFTYCTPPLLFRRRPPQSNYPLYTVLIIFKSKNKYQKFLRVVFQLSLHNLLLQKWPLKKFDFPLMLHTKKFNTIYNYSKGARGLSV
jgi:hypothetical protein